MKLLSTVVLLAGVLTASAQTTISNGGFETWGNTAPGVSAEPTGWYSNKSGSTIATAGPQTCFQDNSVVHSGSASVRLENASFFGTVVNGNVTTGVVNAPTLSKADGYIGTTNYDTGSGGAVDQRRMAFTGMPDSLVGWYQYTPGGAGEKGKVRAILHVGDYFDPETPTTYHPACDANKIGEALFFTPTSAVSTWTRFSVPFTYVSGAGTPAYIMINMTSSADQTTTFSGSKIWIDDLQAVYATTSVNSLAITENDVHVFASGKTVFAALGGNVTDDVQLNLLDMTGKRVHTAILHGNDQHTYDLTKLPAGVYIYQAGCSTVHKTGKLVLE